MKKIILITITMILWFTMSGCQERKNVDIYTSVYALEYITSEIVGDKAVVASIYPANADVHDYEPSPKNLISMCQSDLIFYIGQGLEPFIENGINSTFKDVKCIKITSYDTIDLVTHDGSHSHKGDEDHSNINEQSFDPHIWLDPNTMEAICIIILANLLAHEKYQVYEEEFTNRATVLIEAFKDLANDYNEAFSNVVHKTIIVDHNAYNYLAYRYNLEIKSLRGDNESSDPNSKVFIEIINFAVTNKMKYILATKNESQESLIKSYQTQVNYKDPSINCQVLYLDNLERLTNTNKNFFSIMRENLEVLVTALS